MKKKLWAIALLGVAIFIGIGTYLIAATVTKGLVGKQDLALWYSADSAQTYTRSTSEGYTMTLNKLDWVGVDVHQVYGGGVNRTGAVIISAACDVGMTATRTLWLSPGTWSITDDVDLTGYENLTFAIPRGVDLSISSGKKVSIPGTIDAGPYQIASGSGTLSYNRIGITRAFAQWWNATTVDNTSAATSTATEETLVTTTIPRGLMGTVGGIRIFAHGYLSGILGTKSLNFYWGDTPINFMEAVNDAVVDSVWIFEAEIWNWAGSSIQRIYWKTQAGRTGCPIAYNHGRRSGSQDTTADVIMKITGQCENSSDTIGKIIWRWERM